MFYYPRVGETPPVRGEAVTGPAQPAGSTSAETGGGLIDLNTASVELLGTLPLIAEARAKAIVDYRQQNGPFRSISEITNVPKIGPATYGKIQGLVTVTSPP